MAVGSSVSEKRATENWTLLGLVTDPDGNAFTQSGINSVSVTVTDMSAVDPTANLWATTQPSVSAVFFNSLQTGSGWDLPGGFNFKHIVLPSDLLAAVPPGHSAKVLYSIDTILHGSRELAHYIVVVS